MIVTTNKKIKKMKVESTKMIVAIETNCFPDFLNIQIIFDNIRIHTIKINNIEYASCCNPLVICRRAVACSCVV